MEVKITKQQSAHDLPLPKYATAESAGMDLMANIIEPVLLAKGERKLIPTGLAIQLPSGYEAQIRPKPQNPKTPIDSKFQIIFIY